MLDWITNAALQKLPTDKEAKWNSWTKVNFNYRDRKFWQNSDKHHFEVREVLAGPKILDAMVTIHNSIRHAGQDATGKNVSQTYYCVTHKEIVFFIKLCEICHRNANSKSKGPFKPIISTKPFERVRIDRIDIRSTSDLTPNGTYDGIAHLLFCISQVRMLFALVNKEAATVA